jgi:cytoskeletal protein RodZ
VGTEVQRVSRHPEVTGTSPPTHPDPAAFGPWLREQRQLRGLSRCFVSARTRIAPERIEAIERGALALPADAVGRGTVRQLAAAIGVDPLEALSRMGAAPGSARARTRVRGLPRLALLGGSLVALAAAGALVWAGAFWVGHFGQTTHSGIVYRPDYVDDLLEQRGP